MKPLTFQEGFRRGRKDRLDHKSYDPFRWVHAWAEKFRVFEEGYEKGYFSG